MRDLDRYSQAVSAHTSINLNCWGFIDGTVRPNCRPSQNQRLLFNGHKRVHCLKFQGLTSPDGLLVHLSGPYEGKRHDAAILAQSGLLDDLIQYSPNHCIFGDTAYPLRRQLMANYRAGARGLNPEQELFNKTMSAARVCVEWSFGKISTDFAYLDFKKNLKLYLQPIASYFKVGALMSNCHSCLYGSQTQYHFNCEPPTLEHYLN